MTLASKMKVMKLRVNSNFQLGAILVAIEYYIEDPHMMKYI